MNRALITGAGGSLGVAIARKLSKSCSSLILCCNKSTAECEKLAFELKSKCRCEIIEADFRDIKSIDKALSKVNGIGSPDLIINNAGVSKIALLQDHSEEKIMEIINVNLTAAIMVARHYLSSMIKNKCGNIINISSIWGQVGGSCETVYSASKAGLIGFSKALAKEVGPSGIRVNCLCPGMINSKMNSNFSSSDIKEIISEIPTGRISSPEEIADIVCFLASDDSSYLNGEIIGANGGMMI